MPMETNSIVQNLDGNEQEIDLAKLAYVLWQDKLTIIAAVIVLSIGAAYTVLVYLTYMNQRQS